MSRGFVKEDDQEEVPFVAPRADLPEGVINYVTQAGMDALLAENDQLIAERDSLDITDEKEKRIATNHINARLQLLNNRILSAKVVDLSKQPQDEVRFGALVSLKIGNEKKLQQYQIVGVDEADISKGKISFISPIARLLTDKKVGETAVLQLTKEDRTFKVMDIVYPT
ncbi:GreA/GreB family elongation factor [Gelidibacter maritimus]|uniref:GreA/GreB family elongation factor n=1 Tax=Gelidibacter maritimus TaxID=2761487 RepID=A0A7W2M7Y9_9FLAO|nr:GreA/GreB family elongation factor [Gelidibacter maritimus]MBA6154307.1 GreA/GreB family elongation factor [Gelidibacter maritimus]